MSADPAIGSRRKWLQLGSLALPLLAVGREARVRAAEPSHVTEVDRARMRTLASWTAQALDGPNPVPYASEIFDSKTGASLVRALNAVGPEHDPSAHAEVNAMRLGTRKLQSRSLRGYTLYTTCEPCPMCMACCLWAQVDRVVYGATIADAAQYGHQIMIASTEVVRRSDMTCIVDGPVERSPCLALFADPRMQKVFKSWK